MRVQRLTYWVLGPLSILLTFVGVSYVPGAESPRTLVFGGTLLLALPALLAMARRKLSVTGPEVILPGAYYLTTFHAPLARLVLAGAPIDYFETETLANSVFAAAAVALITELVGPRLKWTESSRQFVDPETSKSHATLGITVTLVGFALLVVWIDSVGAAAILDASLGDMYQLAGGHTSVTFALPSCAFGIVLTADALARWRGGGPRLLHALNWSFAGLVALIVARGGARGPVIELTLAALLMLRASGFRTARRVALAVGTLVLAFFFFVSTTRGDLSSGFSTSTDAVIANARKSADVETRSEFDGVFANSTLITRFVGNAIPYREGQTYLDLPVQMVPRQIVSEKAPPLSVWWVQYVDPVLAARGGGLAFSSYGEGYLNFGAPGAVAQIAFVTLLLAAFYWMLRARRAEWRAAAAVVLAHSYHCHRSEAVHVAYTIRNALLIAVLAVVVDGALRAVARSLPFTSRRLPRTDTG